MTKAVAEIVRRARSLSVDERLEVLNELLNQDGDTKPDSEIVTDEFKGELRRRRAYMDAHPDRLVPMAEAHRKIRESNKRRRGSGAHSSRCSSTASSTHQRPNAW